MSELILIVDDEATLRETLAYNLTHQGYSVETAVDGPQAVEKARSLKPDLIILDIMLPGMDGFEVCRLLRQEMNVPILMLTARDDEIDRVVGLEVGADDYLTKPFSVRELIARVKALLRRVRLIRSESQSSPAMSHQITTMGNLSIDETRHEVFLDGKPLSREVILNAVWGWEYVGDSRSVDVHIRWLREHIEPDPSNPTRLITVRGAGYRFEG